MARTRAPAKECLIARATRLREQKALSLSEAGNKDDVQQPDREINLQQSPIILRTPIPEDQTTTDLDPLSRIADNDCDPQVASSIFKLPLEIRAQIYEYVFKQYESQTNAYAPTTPFYRPDCTGPKCINTALLYTCRRIFFEARFIPLQNATHNFWGEVPSPGDQRTKRSQFIPSHRAASGLTEAHIPHMRNFHFYGSLYDLFSSTYLHLSYLSSEEALYRCRPRHVTITVPFLGWSTWMYGFEPELDSESEENIFQLDWPASLRRLTIRLEHLEVFSSELERAMDRLMMNRISCKSEGGKGTLRYLVADSSAVRKSRWEGPHLDYFRERWQSPVLHLGEDPEDVCEIWYYMVEGSWEVEPGC